MRKNENNNKRLDRILIFGAGERCKTLVELLDRLGNITVEIVDNDSNKWGDRVKKHIIKGPRDIKYATKWCIAVADAEETKKIRNQCIKNLFLSANNEIYYYQLVYLLLKNICEQHEEYKIRENCSAEGKGIVFGCLNGFILGGVEAWTESLSRKLIYGYQKIDTSIIVSEGDYSIPDDLKRHVITVKKRTKRYREDSILEIYKVLAKTDFKYIITSCLDEVMIAAQLLKMKGKRNICIIVINHGGLSEYIEYCRAAWDVFANIDYFLGVSREICSNLKKSVPAEKVLLMTCPVENNLIVRLYSTSLSEPIKIGYAGRIERLEKSIKRMDLLLKLISELDRRNVRYELSLAGDGEGRLEFESRTKENNHTGRIVFKGILTHDELQKFWQKQDIAICLSDSEGHSISQMEAMINGAVPITTDVSGVRDDIRDGDNGFIVPLGDYKMAAERINYLYNNRDMLSIMGGKAHEEIAAKATWENHMKLWNSILKLDKGINGKT